MKTIFRTAFYLRSNYVNKEGNTSVMARIYLNSERLSIGSTGISVNAKLWDKEKERLKGRSTEALSTNLQLDNIQNGLLNIFRRLEFSDELSLERIKSEYLGKKEDVETFMTLFEKYNNDVRQQVGYTKTPATLQKYEVCRKHFQAFLKSKYRRSDLKIAELTVLVIHDFELYLRTVGKQKQNTANKTLKTLKTIVLFGKSIGVINRDPFRNHQFTSTPVDRGFLSEEEVMDIATKDLSDIPRLELVRDIFVFSCFTGLAYIDVANLKPEHIVTLDGKEWIMTRRQKTKVESNVLLLEVPKSIIAKYEGQTAREDMLFPILSNQKMNSYLKEIADICGISKNLTFHLARHTFATLCLSKGVPMESVSKMLGHTNIRTTQIYARITNKKIEHDMEQFADKLGKFNTAMGIGENSWQ